MKMKTIEVKNNQRIQIDQPGQYVVILSKPGIEVEIKGRWRLKQNEQASLNLKIIHAVAWTTSRIDLRGVTDDQARLNISATIVVQPDAQQTNAFLEAKVLLLSPLAWASIEPNLEIEADDVKCSHASTISEIPPEEIFYAQSRGLSKAAAEELIVDGFLS